MDEVVDLRKEVIIWGSQTKRRRFRNSLIIILASALVVLIYMIFYRTFINSPGVIGDIFRFLSTVFSFASGVVAAVVSHISHHISLTNPSNITLLGVFYITLIGGLFFINFIPIEVLFVAAAYKFNPFLAIALALLGSCISFPIDYYLGYKFSGQVKRLIPLSKFYSFKGTINRRGDFAIFFFNLIGIGSQQVTAILGVFRYNKTKMIIFTFVGQLVKFIILAFLGGYIGKLISMITTFFRGII